MLNVSPQSLAIRMLVLLLASQSLVSCGDDAESAALLVELRTDFVPFQEFDSVETELVGVLTRRAAIVPGGSYLAGERIADFDTTVGVYTLEVRLLSEGAVLVIRSLRVSLEGNTDERLGFNEYVDCECLNDGLPGECNESTFSSCAGP